MVVHIFVQSLSGPRPPRPPSGYAYGCFEVRFSQAQLSDNLPQELHVRVLCYVSSCAWGIPSSVREYVFYVFFRFKKT